MNKILDTLTSVFAVFMVMFTGAAIFAFLNVITRPEMITIAIELPQFAATKLPQRIGKVEIWEVYGDEFPDPPDWYHDYEAEIKYSDNWEENIFTNTQTYSQEDYVCMAKNIYFEARNESLKGQMAVAMITMRRVQDPRYPNTVCGVVYDDKQFSWYSDGLSDRPRNHQSYESIALLASAMLDADTAILDFTYGSTHYHATWIEDPYWASPDKIVTKIGRHVFYANLN